MTAKFVHDSGAGRPGCVRRPRRSRRDVSWAGLSVALGLGIGWLDLHTTEVTVTILALLASGLFLGFLRPRSAWRRALLLALGVPAMEIAGLLLHLDTAEPIRLDPRIVLVVAAFALIGSYAGAGVRRALGGISAD